MKLRKFLFSCLAFLSLGGLVSHEALAAFASTVSWNVRPSGSDSNGGGFDSKSGTPGTDYSQQDSPQITYADLVIDATTNTKCTSAGNPFTSAHVGNIINITSGTGFTVQRVQVMSVASSVATCDKSLGTLSSTGGAGKIGGGLASPGMASGLMVASNTLNWKSGTYTCASSSSNVATGICSFPGGTTGAPTRIIGYGTTPGDLGTPPLFQASGIASVTMVAMGSQTVVDNIQVDGANLTAMRGIIGNSSTTLIRVKALNCKNNGISGNAGSLIFCEATGCSAASAIVAAGGCVFGCSSHDNTITGIQMTGAGTLVYSVAYNNVASASASGIQVQASTAINCTAWNNTGGMHGFDLQAQSSRTINCISYGNTGWGYNTPAVTTGSYLINRAGGFNTSGNYSTTNMASTGTGQVVFGFIPLTANPFAASGASPPDLTLNTAAGGGALCRAAGIPVKITPMTALGFLDIGAFQSGVFGLAF